MTLNIVGEARPNTLAFETSALDKATGFREYEARWWFGHPDSESEKDPELNLKVVQALGMGLGTLIRRMGVGPDIVTGHEFRGYSMAIKMALVSGLMTAGARVKNIGLALSPMAYFAQFALDAPSVAMVTASHNENGWTGVKMGTQRLLRTNRKLSSLWNAPSRRSDVVRCSRLSMPFCDAIHRSDPTTRHSERTGPCRTGS